MKKYKFLAILLIVIIGFTLILGNMKSLAVSDMTVEGKIGEAVTINPPFASSVRTAGIPPAACRSWMCAGPAGARWQRLGVLALTSAIVARSSGTPASREIARR